MNEAFPTPRKAPNEQNSIDTHLEEQFNNIETVDINGHALRILDINPINAKSEVPVTLAGGYGTSSPLHNKVNILEMARQQRRVLFVDEPRGIEYDKAKETSGDIDPYFLRQAEAIIATLDSKGIEKTDIVAHSEGCMSAAVVASVYPERIRNLVLFNPGGMIGDDSLVKLVYRFLTEGLNEIKRDREKMSPAARQQSKDGGEGFKRYLMDDPLKSIDELRAMASTQIRGLLKQAKEAGVGISIVHGVHDKVFPMDRIQDQVSRTTPDENLIVDGFYSVDGGHGEFVNDPERYTRIADIALSALEQKQQKAKSVNKEA